MICNLIMWFVIFCNKLQITGSKVFNHVLGGTWGLVFFVIYLGQLGGVYGKKSDVSYDYKITGLHFQPLITKLQNYITRGGSL